MDNNKKELVKDKWKRLIAYSEPNEFETLLEWTMEIWQERCPNFEDYFRKQWVESEFNVWSRSFLEPDIPNSSSSIEDVNS